METHSLQVNSPSEQFADSGDNSLVLTAQILHLVRTAGASQVEILCALSAVKDLIPSLSIKLT